MDLSDIRAYTERGWEVFDRIGRETRIERQQDGPRARLSGIDSARRQIQALRPGWPGDAYRAEDFAHHVHLSALFRRARPR